MLAVVADTHCTIGYLWGCRTACAARMLFYLFMLRCAQLAPASAAAHACTHCTQECIVSRLCIVIQAPAASCCAVYAGTQFPMLLCPAAGDAIPRSCCVSSGRTHSNFCPAGPLACASKLPPSLGGKHDFGRSLLAAVWRVLVQPCCALGWVWCVNPKNSISGTALCAASACVSLLCWLPVMWCCMYTRCGGCSPPSVGGVVCVRTGLVFGALAPRPCGAAHGRGCT